ncbi:hypothetical protein AGLY_011522 [Aphis glycines]|uniref:Uncharacterized protein n=1 Tax=Aphis glycines TaxID=307491 RepID=A0A6G0TCP1_APHGL|nr:hypothetical protein AGLY_011522 [Aphis glycines]
MPVSCVAYGCTNGFKSATRRKNFTPTKWSRLCSDHFVKENYQRKLAEYDIPLVDDEIGTSDDILLENNKVRTVDEIVPTTSNKEVQTINTYNNELLLKKKNKTFTAKVKKKKLKNITILTLPNPSSIANWTSTLDAKPVIGLNKKWKWPIGYFVLAKSTAIIQAGLITTAIQMAKKADARVWDVTCHGTSTNLSSMTHLGCKLSGSYEEMLYLGSIGRVSQPVCRGTLVCREAHLGVPRNFMTINKRFRTISTNWDMFDLVKNCHVNSDLTNLILKSLHLLYENIKKYFPSLDVSSMDWVRNPFIDSAYETALFTTDEESELIDIKNDRGLKLQYSKLVEDIAKESKLKKIKINVDVSSFWINLLHEYPKISRKAMNAILPFSTSYICETAFSSMNAIKTKNRSQLKNLEDDMRVCLSTIRPRRNLIMKRKQYIMCPILVIILKPACNALATYQQFKYNDDFNKT